MQEKPKIIYKFHKLNEYLIDLLESNSLWFSSQNDLNDPYDCKYALSDKLVDEIFRQASSDFIKDLKSKQSHFSVRSEEEFFEMMRPILKSQELMSGLYNQFLFGEKGLRWCVCCFTTDFTNELMWAHYGDNHRGACLEFDLSECPNLFPYLRKVVYNDDFPEINSLDELSDILVKKRKAWEYEKEWRIISNVHGKHSFEKKALKRIIFGLNSDRTKIEQVRKVCETNGFKDVEFKKMEFRINDIRL